MKKINPFLIAIILLAAILRLYNLGNYPSLNADEAAIGYNAYSLIETGKDEHGNSWPIHFQSFNDYKPGGYFYIVLPFVYFFGLNEWSVRLPGAVLGVLTVLVVYLLVRELVEKFSVRDSKFEIIASLFLAISPWHIHFSRGGWEVNVATFFVSLGVLLFLKALRNPDLFALSVLSFVLSLYTYHAARVIVPLLGVALLAFYYREMFLQKSKKLFLGSLLFGVVLAIPLFLSFGSGTARASGVSIFADRGYIDRINEARGRYENPNSIYVRLLHNKPKEITLEFSRNYFEHFWGEFLFLSGDDIQRNKVPEFGQLYLWQFPLLLGAAFALSRRSSRGMKIILAWLLIAPIPAALTFQSPHALRAQGMVIPLTILSAYGLAKTLMFLKGKIRSRRILFVSYCLLITIGVWSFARYIHQYYVHMAKTYPYSSQYGVKELVEYLETNDSENVLVTTRYDQPYILFLFYSQYPPGAFQDNHVLTSPDKFGFSTVPEYDRFKFQRINFEEDKLRYANALIVGTDEEIPDEANVIRNIYGSNGYLYFQVVAN